MTESTSEVIIKVPNYDLKVLLDANRALDEPLDLSEPFEPSPVTGEATTQFVVQLSHSVVKSLGVLGRKILNAVRRPIVFELVDGKTRVRIEASSIDDVVRLTNEARKLVRAR